MDKILEPEFQKVVTDVQQMNDMRLEYVLADKDSIAAMRDEVVKEMTIRTKQSVIGRAAEIQETIESILRAEGCRRWQNIIAKKELIETETE